MSRRASLARVLGTLVLGAVGVGIPSRAAAEPSSEDSARLPALLKAGADASRAKKWDACIESYSAAVAIEESAATFGELGLCEEAAGHFARAHPHLKRAVAGIAPEDARRTRYQAALGRVAEQVAIVFVTVTPTDARLVVDGRPLGRGEGRNVAVEPGRHVFSARLEGYEDASKAITVNAREMPHLELPLKPLPKAISPASPTPTTATAPTVHTASMAEPRSAPSLPVPLRWCAPAWSARGVLGPAACTGVLAALASAATTIGFEVHYTSMQRALIERGFTASTCTPGQPSASSAECEDIYGRRQQRNTARDVLIGTGIAAGALIGMTGVAIALEPLGPRVTANASADGGGIVFLGTW